MTMISTAVHALIPALLLVSFLSCEKSALEIADPSRGPGTHPHVVYTYPPANSVGPYDDLRYPLYRLSVRFDKIMDLASLKRAVHISSPRGVVRLDTSSFSSIGGDVILLYPVYSSYLYLFEWMVGEVYTLRIDTTAQDVDGNELAEPFVMTFVPEPAFRIRSMTPWDGEPDVEVVDTWRYLRIEFNSEIDTSILGQVTVSPSIGRFWRLDGRSVVHDLRDALEEGTTYRVVVNESAHDVQGNRLGETFASTFSTLEFAVKAVTPASGLADVPLYSPIGVEFTGPIDTAAFIQAFSLTPYRYGTLIFHPSGATFTPSPELKPVTGYTIQIDSTMRSAAGHGLRGIFRSLFVTGSLHVVSTNPTAGATNVPPDEFTEIYFNAMLDTATIRRSFHIIPELPYQLDFCYQQCFPKSYFVVWHQAYAPQTTYTITISTELRSVGGAAPQEPYAFSFTTDQ